MTNPTGCETKRCDHCDCPLGSGYEEVMPYGNNYSEYWCSKCCHYLAIDTDEYYFYSKEDYELSTETKEGGTTEATETTAPVDFEDIPY